MIAENALANPASIAVRTLFPAPISSRIRAKIIQFASTAIPIPRIIPAIPGSVSVISSLNALNRTITNAVYITSAIDAAKPGIR